MSTIFLSENGIIVAETETDGYEDITSTGFDILKSSRYGKNGNNGYAEVII